MAVELIDADMRARGHIARNRDMPVGIYLEIIAHVLGSGYFVALQQQRQQQGGNVAARQGI